MRKAISLLLVTLLLTASSTTAFAAGDTKADGSAADSLKTTVSAPADVAGTKYETAVTQLMEKIGLAGYADGSFRPANPINRAEVCTILVKALAPSDADLAAAPNAFDDMTAANISWAKNYVNYGASRKLVAGYGNRMFQPENNVTYNEVVTMLVNALGYTEKDLTGAWPQNYIAKATELGIYKDVDVTDKGDTPAVRGDVALMTAVVADKIVEAGKNSGTQTKPDDQNPTDQKPSDQKPSDQKPSDSNKPAGTASSDNDSAIFKNAGGAFGMINGISSVTNKDGKVVDQIEFLMNGTTYNLNTTKADLIADVSYDGSLYYIKFNANKEVRDIFADPSKSTAKYYGVAAGETGWVQVKNRTKSAVTYVKDDADVEFTIDSGAVLYKATFDGDSIDGYEKGSLSDIEAGAVLRAYRLTDSDNGIADAVVYVTKKDASKHDL